MERATEYDPVSGVEIEICRTCEELDKHFRAESAYLRRFDDLFGHHDESDYDEVRTLLISARDFVLQALTRHQQVHSEEQSD